MENTYMRHITMEEGIFGEHYEVGIIKEQINEFFSSKIQKKVRMLSAYISGALNNFIMTEQIILFV